jgi:hypothetical protein
MYNYILGSPRYYWNHNYKLSSCENFRDPNFTDDAKSHNPNRYKKIMELKTQQYSKVPANGAGMRTCKSPCLIQDSDV